MGNRLNSIKKSASLVKTQFQYTIGKASKADVSKALEAQTAAGIAANPKMAAIVTRLKEKAKRSLEL